MSSCHWSESYSKAIRFEYYTLCQFIKFKFIVDRDQYIEIMWDNIRPGWKSQYNKCEGDCETHGVPYDCDSIMHYIVADNDMRAIDPATCKLDTPNNVLRQSDIQFIQVFNENLVFYYYMLIH